jgi:hypothetical protein
VFFLRRVAVSLASFAACLVGGCDLASTTECAPDLVFGLQVTGNERQGAPERPGIYTLTVTAPGFVTKTVNGIEVRRGRCSVTPAEVAVELEPVSS